MKKPGENIQQLLLQGLTEEHQQPAVQSNARRLLVIAGAGSGKTEVMARRVAWWVGVEEIPKDKIVAFTFTEAAAEELKFRIRTHIEGITPEGEDATLGGMYVGTIHGFCLKLLRELAPETYYNYDILDDAGRIALIQRGYERLLGLRGFQHVAELGQFEAISRMLRGYDLLNEYDLLDVELPGGAPPSDVALERDWIKEAQLRTDVGIGNVEKSFGKSAARFYAYMRARRFLDFSTSQSELTRLLRDQVELQEELRKEWTHIVVDEVQDINPVQDVIIRLLVGSEGRLTAVGDHRQAIYAFRGGRVDLMEGLHAELKAADDGEVIELPSNFRSTPRIIRLANEWSQTIGSLGSLPNPEMTWGNTGREDYSEDHIAIHHFEDRETEADWIARTINSMVKADSKQGARHDDRKGDRGISYSDVAVLIRSSTDVRTYQETLRRHGIPAVVRAGPDLYSQAEVLLFLALLAESVGIEYFFGSEKRPNSLPGRIANTLDCGLEPEKIVAAACRALRADGLPLQEDAENRLLTLARAINHRLESDSSNPFDVKILHCREAVKWVKRKKTPRRVFPQQLYHWFLEEAGVYHWDGVGEIGRPRMFHLGQFGKLITSIETPGWTTAGDLRYQIIALSMWGAANAKTDEAPLLVPPEAVTITTVHSAKGLQFSAVFLADVNARRFPSIFARRLVDLPIGGDALDQITPASLSDNENYDNERRLMYVALTRSERYLFVSYSGRQRSKFITELNQMAEDQGIFRWDDKLDSPKEIKHKPQRKDSDQRLATSFSDLRYYLECPRDFYFRKVLGFAPTIDQAFGYGRGVHNILREIHKDPRRWAELSRDRDALKGELQQMVESGLFYLRYTTGEPLGNMRTTARHGVEEYVKLYAEELGRLEFEPEREFETLIPGEELLISGSIDLVRLDDPPRITIIDFKSGEKENENQSGLSEELMRLQIGIYGLAARHELEYEPEHGLIRYIGEKNPEHRQVGVDVDEDGLRAARKIVVKAGRNIKKRKFDSGPSQKNRCETCDFSRMCHINLGRKKTR